MPAKDEKGRGPSLLSLKAPSSYGWTWATKGLFESIIKHGIFSWHWAKTTKEANADELYNKSLVKTRPQRHGALENMPLLCVSSTIKVQTWPAGGGVFLKRSGMCFAHDHVVRACVLCEQIGLEVIQRECRRDWDRPVGGGGAQGEGAGSIMKGRGL